MTQCVPNYHECLPFIVITIQSFPYLLHITGNTTGASSGAVTACLSIAIEFATILYLSRGIRVVHIVKLHVFTVFGSVLRFPRKTMVRLYSHLFSRRFTFYFCYLYLFSFTGVQRDYHIRLCSCRFTVTRRMSLVEQELLTLPEHLSSVTDFSELRVAQSLVFCMWFIVDHRLSFCVFLFFI